MKSFKAMMAEVAQPEPAEEKAFKAQHTVVADKHPVALETQHKGTKPKAKNKADQEGDANYDLAYESVDLTEEPKEEIPMMMNQLAFICYAAEEISGMLKLNSDPEEWFQNKLAATHSEMKTLYSYMQGQNQMDYMNMGYADDMDEELSPKQKKIDHNKNNKIDGEDLAMIRAKKNEGFASDAQRKAIWASKNEKGVKEELRGDQHKIDKNKNGKIDKHDFKLLNKEAAEQVDEGRGDAVIKTTANNMDDNDKHISKLKKAGIFAQQGAGAGHHIIVGQRDHEKAKKLLAGSLKEEVEQVDEAQSHQAKTTMKHISNPTAGEKKAAKDIKPGIKGVADRIAMLASAQARGALKKESAYEKDMDDKKKVIVKGVKGMKSTPFTRTFRNMAAYDKWSDSEEAGNHEVHQVMHESADGSLNELSQETLKNYHAKAALDYRNKKEKLSSGTLTTKDYQQGRNRVKGLNKAADKMEAVTSEDVVLDEAFQQGIVKFKDGTSAVLKKEDADVLNKLLGGMSAGSVKKMTETAMKDKTGFAEILAFAKEAV